VNDLWLLLAILVCPLVMGGMMVWMMRGMRADRRRTDSEEDAGG